MMNPRDSTTVAAMAAPANCETSSARPVHAQGRTVAAAAAGRGFAVAVTDHVVGRSRRGSGSVQYYLRLLVCIWLVLCVVQHIEAKSTSKKKASTHFAKTSKTHKPAAKQHPATKAPWTPPKSYGKAYNVLAYGAKGNGVSNDSPAFLSAWAAACHSTGTVTILVPAGFTFLLVSPTDFSGAGCSATLVLEVDGIVVAPKNPSEWKSTGASAHWIQFTDCKGFTLHGRGIFDGSGAAFWAKGGSRPMAIRFLRATNVAVLGITIRNSPQVHLKFNNCHGGLIKGVTITSPGNTPNTDGIHFQTAVSNFEVADCRIGTGDDCVSVGTGTSFVSIHDTICGPGHGISIGSLGAGKSVACVTDISVYNIVFVGTTNGCRIKTFQGGMGSAKQISYNNVTMVGVANPIYVDQFYGGHSVSSNAVQLSAISFTNIKGTTISPVPVYLGCSASHACSEVVMSDINLVHTNRLPTSSYCASSYGTASALMNPRSCLKPMGGVSSLSNEGNAICGF